MFQLSKHCRQAALQLRARCHPLSRQISTAFSRNTQVRLGRPTTLVKPVFRSMCRCQSGWSGDAVEVHVHGASGRLGTAISSLPSTKTLAHRSREPIDASEIDIIVDVSLPAGLDSLTQRLLDGNSLTARLPILVIGTTGDLPLEALRKYSARAPVYVCPNFSTGIRLLMPTLRTLGAHPSFTTAVTEIHHVNKLDAPSGTAKILANALQTAQGFF